MENDLELASVIFCVDKKFQYSCIALLNCLKVAEFPKLA